MKIDEKLTFDEKLTLRKNHAQSVFYGKIISIFVIFALVILYFVSPMSQVSSYKLSGNYYFTEQEILSDAGLNKKTSLYSINSSKVKENLKSNPLIKDCSVSCSVFGLKISISEICPVFKYKTDLSDVPYYTNEGELLNKDWLSLASTKDHLEKIINSETQNIFETEFNPGDMDKNTVVKLSSIMLGIPDESRNYISFIGDVESDFFYCIYLHRGNDDFYLRIKLPATLSDNPEDFSDTLKKDSIDIYYKLVTDYDDYQVEERNFDDGKTRDYSKYYSLKIQKFNDGYKVYRDNGSEEQITVKDN